MQAAKMVKQPLWKIAMGMLVMLDKMKMLAYFGAAMPRLKTATEDGDLKQGMQFIGQSQGLIRDVSTVDEIIQRILAEAKEAKSKTDEILSAV